MKKYKDNKETIWKNIIKDNKEIKRLYDKI